MKRAADFRNPAPNPWTWVDFTLVGTAAACALAALLAFFAIFLLVNPAGAHEADKGWSYPWECCHDKDCAEISGSRVKPVAGGYVIDGRFNIAQKDVRVSPDGRYHACFPKPDKMQCFFAPPNSF